MRQFVYINPKTYQQSTKKYTDISPIKAVEKIYPDIIAEYSKSDIIIPPTLILYVKDITKPKVIYGFEANVASFSIKSHTVDLQINGRTETINVTNSVPRITEITVSDSVKKQIKSRGISNEPKDFFRNYLPNQTYDLSDIFQNLSTSKYIITINDYSMETTTQLFQVTDNYLYFIDIISNYVQSDWLKSNNFQIRADRSENMLSVQITSVDPKEYDITQTELNIYAVNLDQQQELHRMLVDTYGKKHIT